MENINENYRKIEIECTVCKTKFEIWLSMNKFNAELEEKIRNNFHAYCPICKIMEELKGSETK